MQSNFTLKKWGSFLKIVPLLCISFFLLSGKINAQCSWSFSTVYPIPIQDHAVVGIGNTIYSFGGYTNAVATTNSYKFDGTVWTAIAALPQALIAGGAVSDGTNVYIIGGYASGAAQPVLYRYNVATNTYTTLASAPNATISSAVAITGGKIYKIAGAIDGAGTATAVVNIYDIASNTWTTGAAYPAATTWARGYGQGSFVYVGGGIAGTPTLKTYRYSVATNTWDDVAMTDLPQTRWGASSDFYNNGFIMAGGVVNGNAIANISNSVISYDIATDSWSSLPNMVGERYRGAAGVSPTGGAYVVGGVSQTSTAFNGTPENQKLFCVSSTPCSGTPVPGNTQSSVTTVCPNINFTISAQNTAVGSGITYQWQSAPAAAGPWTTIGTTISNSFSTSQTAASFYRVNVTCSGNTGTSTPVQVLLTPPSGCYCFPTYTNGCTGFGDNITRVQLVTLDNPSACSAAPFYTYYSAVPAPTLIKGGVYPLTVSMGADVTQYFGAWIDFNQDGDFDDAGEFLGVSGNAGANGTVSINITIPAGATTGVTRMRIRGGDDVAPGSAQSCGPSNSTYGEAEDYNVNIQPCVNIAITAPPVDATIQCSGNASFSVTATGSAPIYGWEVRQNASSVWQPVTNGGIYSGATTATLVLSNVPSTQTGYQYRALVSNPCTGVDFTSVATLTVSPLVAAVNPSSATICTGGNVQLTLTNASSPTTQTFNATGLPIAIPDNNPAGINSAIPVVLPVGSVITQVEVKFSIPAHTYPGDLDVVLKAPNGQIINLDYFISATGAGPGAGMVNTNISSAGGPLLSSATAPYTGTFRADAVLLGNPPAGPTGFIPTTATWNPLYSTPSGNWTLAVYDAFAGDFGSLTAWSITFTYGAPAAGVWTASPAAPNTMWLNAALNNPYIAGTLANNIYVNPTVTTNYSVIYSTATPCTSAPTVVPVTVINPVGAVTQPTNKSACVGASAVFTVSAAGGPNTYQWQVSSDGGATWTNITGATSSTLTVSAVTSTMNNYRYRAVITASPCAGSVNSNAAVLTVNPLPIVTLATNTASITPGQTTTITASSNPAAGASGFVWTLNGSTIAGTGNTQSVRIDGLGVYKATVTDVNGCVNTSGTLTIGAAASDRLWIYPNPSPGQFQVRLYYGGTATEDRKVSIYNSAGQLVVEKDFVINAPGNPYLRMDFDLSKMAGGTYVVKVNNRHTEQIVAGLVVISHN